MAHDRTFASRARRAVAAATRRPRTGARSTYLAVLLVGVGLVPYTARLRGSAHVSGTTWVELSLRDGRLSWLRLENVGFRGFAGLIDTFDRGRAFLIQSSGDYRSSFQLLRAFPAGVAAGGFDVPLLAIPLTGCLWLSFALARLLLEYVRKPSLEDRRRARGVCIACAYDLTGNLSGICPECGTPTRPSSPRASITRCADDGSTAAKGKHSGGPTMLRRQA